jgi:predicted AlkP superfamily pyrophosphatase or phosphodiesterase
MKKYLYIICILLLTAGCTQKPDSDEGKVRKAVYVIIDGVTAEMVERLELPAIEEIASEGTYGRCFTGGTVGRYDQTPTISAIGYTNILTATWANKHNVWGNDNLSPNYNYWTIFRIAKEQDREVTTGLFSSWQDNRTVLLGEGKPETGNLVIDYVCDGYELDHEAFPNKEYDLRIFDIDEHVSKKAAECIRENAPDLSWVYLWYTDDAGHIFGNGETMDDFIRLADRQVARIWEAVKYREANFNEEWMVVITTDHGREYNGFHHGGQSCSERSCWVSTNVKANERLTGGSGAIIDINPSICRFMDFKVPQDVLWEQDGVSFYGDIDIMNMEVEPYGRSVCLTWECLDPSSVATVWAAASNEFNKGGRDEWVKVGEVPAGDCRYIVDLSILPESDFYKFVLETPSGTLNRWHTNVPEEYKTFKFSH